MNDKIIRYVVSFVLTGISLVIYYAGYISGAHGWWWTAFAMLIVYGIVYKIIDGGK